MLTSKTNKVVLSLSAIIIILLILFAIFRDNTKLTSLANVHKLVDNKKIEKVIISKDFTYLRTKEHIYKIASSQVSPELFKNYRVEIDENSNLIIYILCFVVLVSITSYFVRRWQKKKTISKEPQKAQNLLSEEANLNSPIQSIKSDVKFSDIGGISDVKVELEEVIDFMKNPLRYKSFGARMPRGVLLVGPPGVGKTMIAKAVAHEAGVPFYYQSAASFVQIYVGMGAKRVHELFLSAKNNSPSIIFIDEIDAVGKRRDGQRNDEREATLNQLLTEMDGFENSSGVIVIAATNKIDVLDDALLRAGRFDRRIFVELPTKDERESILLKYLDKIPHKLDVKSIANMTVGFNGASLATLVNESALLSLRQNDAQVTVEHFYQVKDKVMFGKKKLQMLNEKQKEYRVTYQSAKVLCATYFNLPFEKLILSNEQLTPNTDEPLIKNELEARIKMHLGGMAGCSLKYQEHSSNAKYDLDEAKKILDRMLKDYGMGSSLLYNEDEKEVVIRKLFDDTKRLIEDNPLVMSKIEAELSEKESITKDVVKGFLL